MLKYFTIFLIFCLPFSLEAQLTVLQTEIVDKNFELQADDQFQDIELKVTLRYDGEETTQLQWNREVLYIEDNWETAVCDIVLCWLPHVSSSDFEIEPGREFDMAVHLYPNGKPGDSAVVQLEIFDVNDRDVRQVLTYSFYNDVPSSVSVTGESAAYPTLFPNPTGEMFHIKNDDRIHSVELYNVIGQMVLKKEYRSGQPIYVSDFKQGMYFVKLLDEHNRIVRTLRLNKNQ